MTHEVIEEAKRREINPGDDPAVTRQWADVKYGSSVLPDRLPAFRGLLTDSEGLIWLEGYRTDETRPGRYFVFSLDAAHVANVTAPAGFRATEVGPDYVLGVTTDADGVERIAMYRLTRH